MLELEALVVLLYLPKLLELGSDVLLHLDALGHDQPLSRLLTPTRQHEGMNGKRSRDILHLHALHLAQADGCGFELIAVAVRRPRSWHGHVDTPELLVQGVH